MYTDTSTSEFIHAQQSSVSDTFTEIEVLPSAGFNMLIRAKRDGKWWVLKGLKESVRNDTAYRELLRKEYDILSQAASSNVVRVNSLEYVEGYGQCIVMEWIDGITLKEWLSLPHTYKDRVSMVRKLADALTTVHEKQIVHRDLKPSNIMITRNGSCVKLIDFGLSDADDYAAFKQPAGTKGYYSPEQQHDPIPDRRNDIFSLGMIMSQMSLGWR